MNILRPQKPYVFRPPAYHPAPAFLLKVFSRHVLLKHNFNIRSVKVTGAEAVRNLGRAGHSMLITPNHADHPDPHVLVYGASEAGVNLSFMAAREGFEKGVIARWALQRMGAFSVDREGADIAAIKMAMKILEEGKFPLVIFPEGEIYHHHETLDYLNDGVATILLRANARMDEGRACYLVPTGILYRYDPSVEETFPGRLARLEERVTWKPRPDLDAVERIYRLGRGLLSLKEEEYLGEVSSGPFTDRLRALSENLVLQIEAKHGALKGDDNSVPSRVKWLRNKIRKQLTDEQNMPDKEKGWELYDDLDRLFAAVQVYSYPGQYVRENPTVTRIAETLLKLEEDILGEGTYPAPCDAAVRFGEPVDVKAFLRDGGYDVKSGVQPMTELIGREIGKMLEEMTGA